MFEISSKVQQIWYNFFKGPVFLPLKNIENAIANIVRPPSDAVTKLISTLKNRNSFADASNI